MNELVLQIPSSVSIYYPEPLAYIYMSFFVMSLCYIGIARNESVRDIDDYYHLSVASIFAGFLWPLTVGALIYLFASRKLEGVNL